MIVPPKGAAERKGSRTAPEAKQTTVYLPTMPALQWNMQAGLGKPPQTQTITTFSTPQPPMRMDRRGERAAALQALKDFDALDEYIRKVKAYYHDDTSNLIYDLTMGEALMLKEPSAATPYWQKANQLKPDDPTALRALIQWYGGQKDDAALLKLIDPILVNDSDYPTPLPLNVVDLYTRQNQLDRLVQLYLANAKKHPEDPNTGANSMLGPDFREKLNDMGMTDEVIALDEASLEAKPDDDEELRLKVAQMLLQRGDKQGLEKQLAALLFPVHGPSIWAKGPGWGYEDIPDSRPLDLIRIAQAEGILAPLKEQAEANYHTDPNDLDAMETLVLILVVAHDSEALTLVPAYCHEVEESTKGRGNGFAGEPLFAIFGQLLDWPQAHELLRPTLDSGLKAETAGRDAAELDRRVARLALMMQDTPHAQELLRDALDHLEVISSQNSSPQKSTDRKIFVDQLAPVGRELIDADMREEFKALVGAMADSSRYTRGSMPSDRAGAIAALGEAAFDAGWKPEAQVAAETALKQLQTDWRNPAQTSYQYDLLISAKGVHQIADLLLRLGLSKDFDTLHDLLPQWSTAGISLDNKTLLEDIDHLKKALGDDPSGLAPGVWLEEAGNAPPADATTREVAWDLGAHVDMGAPRDLDELSAPYFPSVSGSLSTDGRGLPQLDGKISIQILAGDAWDNLRIVKTVSAAASRGTTEVELKATDRFLRAIGLTNETQPKVFVGPVVPISLGPNLLGSSFHVGLFSFSYPTGTEDLLVPDQAVKISTVPGGPEAGGSYRKATCPGKSSSLELVGEKLELTPGTTYCQSGWMRGGQWAIRYLDAKGNKIADAYASGGGSDEWHFVRQIITTPEVGASTPTSVPPGAVTLVPVLSAPQNASIEFQDLYFGVVEKKALPSPPRERSDLFGGLQGAAFLAESAQGGLLAAAFKDGNVRCFDLKTHQEVGTAGKLPAAPVDVAFVNNGTQIVSADTAGNVLVRGMQGAAPGKVVYQAHWQIDLLTASDTSIIAVGNRNVGNVTVVDLATGREVSRIKLQSLPLTTMVISPDGKNLFCRYADLNGRIWSTLDGQPLSIVTNPPQPPPPSPPVPPWPMNPFNPLFRRMPFIPGPRREEGAFPINEVALAHFFKIPRVMETSEWHEPCWLQVQAGFFVLEISNSVLYGMRPNAQVFYQFETGPITACCLSTQSNDVYTVDAAGTLAVWHLPNDVKIPSFTAPPEIEVGSGPPQPSSPTVPPSPTALVVTASGHLRGFPHTILNQTLDISVMDNLGNPAGGADVHLKVDNLEGVRFSTDETSWLRADETAFKTEADGSLKLYVKLGMKPGNGTIHLAVSCQNLKQSQDVALESIDSNAPLNEPRDVSVSSSGQTMTVTWNDQPDNRTAFLIQRKIDTGPWQTIAIVPADATSFVDPNAQYNHNYSYNITSTNDAEYGLPPKLPPPPDRLGDFLP